MHTLEIEGWIVHHNGGFDGDVELHAPGTPSHVTVVPFSVLAAIVAEKIRADRISALEDAEPRDLLK